MLVEAFTVVLALIGTTLSCMNTGARVTYAMGKDDEVPEHFGMLHAENLTPHRAIWTLATISARLKALAGKVPASGKTNPADLINFLRSIFLLLLVNNLLTAKSFPAPEVKGKFASYPRPYFPEPACSNWPILSNITLKVFHGVLSPAVELASVRNTL